MGRRQKPSTLSASAFTSFPPTKPFRSDSHYCCPFAPQAAQAAGIDVLLPAALPALPALTTLTAAAVCIVSVELKDNFLSSGHATCGLRQGKRFLAVQPSS
eukprot:1157437-Pelagomonas_calceolata.AAC.9